MFSLLWVLCFVR